MNKTIALKTIKELPPNFSVVELFEKLIFIEKVEEGIKDADSDNLYSTKEAKKKLKKWLK